MECTKTIDEHSKEKCEQIPSSVGEKKVEKYHGEILIFDDDDVEDQHKIKLGYWIQKYGLTFEDKIKLLRKGLWLSSNIIHSFTNICGDFF